MRIQISLFLTWFSVSILPLSLNANHFTLAPNQQIVSIQKSQYIENGLRFTTNGFHGPMPVILEMAPHALDIGVTSEMIETILSASTWRHDVVTLKRLFNISINGRSVVLPLKWSHYLRFNGRVYKAIKIKGITDHGQKPKMTPYKTPKKAKVRQPVYNLSIDDEGRVRVKKARLKPTGTLLFDLVLNEYETMLEANENGIQTGLPLGVGQYQNLRFRGKEVGFVVIAIPEYPDFRLGDELSNKIIELKETRKTTFDFLLGLKSLNTQVKFELDNAAEILRSLHQKGRILKNPHFQNFGHTQHNDIFIYDFENVLKAENVSRQEFMFWVFRDFYTLFRSSLNQFNSPAHLESMVFRYLDISKTYRRANGTFNGDTLSIQAMIQFAGNFPSLSAIDGFSLEDLFTEWSRVELIRAILQWAGQVYDQMHAQPEPNRFNLLPTLALEAAI